MNCEWTIIIVGILQLVIGFILGYMIGVCKKGYNRDLLINSVIGLMAIFIGIGFFTVSGSFWTIAGFLFLWSGFYLLLMKDSKSEVEK